MALAHRLTRIPVRTDRDGTLLAEVLAAEISEHEKWMLEAVGRIRAARYDLAEEATRAQMVAKWKRSWQSMGLSAPTREIGRASCRERV